MEGEIRLNGTQSYASGRIQIYHNDEWGTVCDDGFNKQDADVACRQLNYIDAITYGNKYGAGSGRIWLDNLNCNGTESALADCPSNGWGIHNCAHYEDVGVTCRDGI